MSVARQHVHRGHGAEMLGFACRWLLLAGAAVLVLAVAWQSLQATVGVSREIGCRFDALDVVSPTDLRRGQYCAQPGLIDGDVPASGAPPVLAFRSAGPILEGLSHADQTFWILWPDCQAGQVASRIIGAPYSAFAFQQETADVLGVPAGRALTLIDARLLSDDPNAPGLDETMWRRTLDDAAKNADVALLCTGSIKQYQSVKERCRRAGREVLVLYRPGKPIHVLQRIAGDLRRPKREGLTVVTADSELAALVARDHFQVDFIPSTNDDHARP